jgi:hypothetical protein
MSSEISEMRIKFFGGTFFFLTVGCVGVVGLQSSNFRIVELDSAQGFLEDLQFSIECRQDSIVFFFGLPAFLKKWSIDSSFLLR